MKALVPAEKARSKARPAKLAPPAAVIPLGGPLAGMMDMRIFRQAMIRQPLHRLNARGGFWKNCAAGLASPRGRAKKWTIWKGCCAVIDGPKD